MGWGDFLVGDHSTLNHSSRVIGKSGLSPPFTDRGNFFIPYVFLKKVLYISYRGIGA